MRSILSYINYETALSSFFDDSALACPESPYTLTLSRKVEGSLKRSQYQIAIPNLIEISNFGYVESCFHLNLSIFEPFIEDSPESQLQGFFLNQETFYTENKSDLDTIITYFKKVCIFTHIEDELVFLKEIGKGSTSVVYLAQNWEKTSQFAVKCISKKTLHKLHAIKNLINEINIMRKVKHRNLTELYCVYEDDEQVYLVMEYLPYGNLLKRVSGNGTLTEDKVKVFIRNLLQTVNYLHSRDIVHRDLKLENILMTDENSMDFKIIDFGLAYDGRSIQKRKCGSPGYVAPEMLRNEEYNYKIDIFSIGVILFIMLHGEHPFEAGEMNKILKKNLECKLKISKSISKLANDMILTTMEPYPEKRPDTSKLLEHPWIGLKLSVVTNPSIATCVSPMAPFSA